MTIDKLFAPGSRLFLARCVSTFSARKPKEENIHGKMHVDEVDIDRSLVSRLLTAQFPQWADRSIEPVQSAGTNNAIYRLGSDMAVRLPCIEGATGPMEKEHLWLLRLAPHLPLAIPVPLAQGRPGEGYPWPRSIYRWLEGENAERGDIAEEDQAARALAHFITALQWIDPLNWPAPSPLASGSTSGTDKARDGAQVASFAQAGATWWMEGFDPLQTVEQVRHRIHQGPPRF